MLRMNKLLDKDVRQAVREACACCLSGRHLETSKAIAKRNGTLKDRIKATNKANHIGSVMMQKDGRLKVAFAPEGLPEYGCACFGRKVKGPLPITYCYCCGGHVKHHLQIALGRKLACQVRTSALSRLGKDIWH